MTKKIFYLLGYFLITALLLGYLFSQPRTLPWGNLWLKFHPGYAAAYFLLYGLGLFLRAWRYRWLIQKASGGVKAPLGSLTLITAVRNMLVDFLPARIGGLAYPLLVNRILAVDLAHCLTSLTYAFVFDLLTLGPLLGLLLAWDAWVNARSSPGLWILAVLVLFGGVVVLVFLEPITRGVTEGYRKRLGQTPSGRLLWNPIVLNHLERLRLSFFQLRRTGGFGYLLVLSTAIRLIKYSLLYILLMAVVEALMDRPLDLAFSYVFLSLMASEIAASLPISGLAAIGFYEGVLGTALTAMGIHPAQGISLALAMHLLSQVVDYSLGCGALLFLFFRWAGKFKARPGSGAGGKGLTSGSIA